MGPLALRHAKREGPRARARDREAHLILHTEGKKMGLRVAPRSVLYSMGYSRSSKSSSNVTLVVEWAHLVVGLEHEPHRICQHTHSYTPGK